jgi:hypothetical protein
MAFCLGFALDGKRAVAARPADGPPPPPAAAATPAAPAQAAAPALTPAPGAAAPAAAPAPAPVAATGPAAPEATKAFPKLSRPPLNHHLQFGLAILPGSGYRGIFPYQENVPCGVAGKRVCTSAVPFFLDVQPSFGFTPRWDALVDLRFGIATDFTQTRQFAVAPGVRYWVDAEYHTKFFATLQVALDTTTQHNPQIKNNDIAFRNSNGFMFEVMRNFGIYLQFGETIGFRRWLRFEIDGGVGVQARIP